MKSMYEIRRAHREHPCYVYYLGQVPVAHGLTLKSARHRAEKELIMYNRCLRRPENLADLTVANLTCYEITVEDYFNETQCADGREYENERKAYAAFLNKPMDDAYYEYLHDL